MQVSLDTFIGWINSTAFQGYEVYAKVLYAQARIETGNFTSRIYRDANNLFGMRPSQQRERFWDSVLSTANGNFASYADHFKSVQDRIDLDRANGIVPPRENSDIGGYMHAVLSKGYSSDADQYRITWGQITSQYTGSFVDAYPAATDQPYVQGTNHGATDGGDADGGSDDGGSGFGLGLTNGNGITKFGWVMLAVAAVLAFWIYRKVTRKS